MKEPVVHHESQHLEYNIWDTNCLKYKGYYFTGTLLFDDTNPVSYTEYTNGDYDGDEVIYYKNGQLAEKNIYKNGKYVSGKEWYENGQVRYNSENGNTIFDEDGIVTQKNGIWFYKNGKVRFIKEDEVTKIFTEKGNLAILIEPSDVVVNGYPTSKLTYYNKVLVEDYKSLIEHIYLHPEDNINFRQKIFVHINSWIIKLYNSNYKNEAVNIIETIIIDSENRLKTNLYYTIQSLEENFIHNSKIFIKLLQNGEYSSNSNDNLSTIIF